MKSISRKENKTVWIGFAVSVLLLLLAGGFRARAAGTGAPRCASNVTFYYRPDGSGSFLSGANIYISNLSPKANITNIKCSSKKIKAQSTGKNIVLYVRTKKSKKTDYQTYALKNGQKARVTFTVKQNGASYKLRCNVTFRKEGNPLRSVKVGKKTTKKFKKSSSGYKINVKKINSSKVKIKVTLKPGYKLAILRAGYCKKGWRKEESKILKNGGTVSTKYLGASLCSIYVNFYEKADLQGIATPSKLKKSYGYRTVYYKLNFK